MKTLLLAIASVTFVSGAAFASSADGTITKLNPEARVITLEDGHSYTIPRDVAMPTLQVGESVSLLLNDEGDKVTTVLR